MTVFIAVNKTLLVEESQPIEKIVSKECVLLHLAKSCAKKRNDNHHDQSKQFFFREEKQNVMIS